MKKIRRNIGYLIVLTFIFLFPQYLSAASNDSDIQDNPVKDNQVNTKPNELEAELILNESFDEPDEVSSEEEEKELPEEEQPLELFSGVVLSSSTHVYSEPSNDSPVLESFREGEIIQFHIYSGEWYMTTVSVNGSEIVGYIDIKDIDKILDEQPLSGFAKKQPISVYTAPTRSSDVWKNYQYGHILKYRTFSSQWHIATVYVNGEAKTGYIHNSDVGSNVESVRGVALVNSTPVYSNTSRSSVKLKTYKKGHILKYRAHDANWYKATVYINGKATPGYIHKTDVDTSVSNPVVLRGIGIKATTNIYASPSTSSKVLKKYKQGHNLKYETFVKGWYKATVYINGKPQTGYINGNDVGNESTTLKGFGLKNPTTVYSSTDSNSQGLKSYKIGQLLQYKVHNSSWFKATVYVNGKAQTGYIDRNDVSSNTFTITGTALANKTTVYSSTSRSASSLKSYKKGTILKYRPYNSQWYQATVYVNGIRKTGYIHVNDVDANIPKIVNPYKVYSYNDMVSDIKKLQRAYPDIISYKIVGKSEYGRDIYAVSLGKGEATSFINGSHHAREWLTTNLNMNIIDEYASAYRKNNSIDGFNVRRILNDTTIWFIPMVNPDGVILQQEGLQAYPKSMHNSLIAMNKGSRNFTRWKANIKGIDLNRQYDAGWSTIRNSPSAPSYQNYKGTKPESESEVKAVLKLVEEIDAEIAVAYHSSGRILYWEYYQDPLTRNRDLNYAREISRMTGYGLYNPPNPSGGGFTDWFIQAKKRPGFTPEITPYVFETSPSLSQFPRAWQENKAVGLYVAQESAKLYKARTK